MVTGIFNPGHKYFEFLKFLSFWKNLVLRPFKISGKGLALDLDYGKITE